MSLPCICAVVSTQKIEDINLVRDEGTGKSRGFAFCKYEDARSCVLAVDNLTGSKVLGRSLRVDHCEKYRLPKELLEKEEEAVATGAGHAYQDKELANGFSIAQGQDLFAKQPSSPPKEKTGSKEERREAKRKRKDDRHERRREREERHDRKEEKKREKRARRYREDTGDDDEEERSHKKKRKKRHRRHDEG